MFEWALGMEREREGAGRRGTLGEIGIHPPRKRVDLSQRARNGNALTSGGTATHRVRGCVLWIPAGVGTTRGYRNGARAPTAAPAASMSGAG